MTEPIETTAGAGAVETARVAEAAASVHLLAVESYGSLGIGAMQCIADGGSLADVLEFVGNHMNARDHVDDESIALFERAKAAADARPGVPAARDGGPVDDEAKRLVASANQRAEKLAQRLAVVRRALLMGGQTAGIRCRAALVALDGSDV